MQAQHYAFHTYGQKEGLKNLNTRCLLQDRQGLLWVCTEIGLFRYAGSDFEPVPLQGIARSPYITGISQDPSDRIWIATEHELVLRDTSGMHAVSSPDREFEFDLHAALGPVPDEPGSFYFVSRHKLMIAKQGPDKSWQSQPFFTPSQVARYPVLEKISSLTVIAHDNLWFGCGTGICSFLNGVISYYGKGAGLPSELWNTVFLDRQKKIWVRSERTLYYFAPESHRFLVAPAGLPSHSLGVRNPAMVEDPQGRILINLNSGLARLENNRWKIYRERTDLPPHQIADLLVDRQGSIWMGLQGHGMVRWLGYDELENWTALNGLSSEIVWGFLRDSRNALWVATESNLEFLKRDTMRIQPRPDIRGVPMRRIQSMILTPNGHIWTGSDEGRVIDYDPRRRVTHLAGKLSGIFQLLPDETGRIWICSISGLYLAEAAHPEHGVQAVTDADAPHGRVYEVQRDSKKNLWVIGDAGLFRFANNTWKHIRLPKDYQTILSAQIAIAADDTLWLSGSSPSLLHLKVNGNIAEQIDSLDAGSLRSSVIYCVTIDRRGWLWLGTDNGLIVFDGRQSRHLSTEDGLIWNDVNSGALYEDKDGSIWIGTSGGMSHLLHPEKIFSAEPLSLWVDDASIGTASLSLNTETRVLWGHHPLVAHLSALDFTREYAITFRFRMEGLEEEWQDTSLNDIRYPPIPPGSYRLALMAIDRENGRRSQPAYIAFTVLPPWWRARWVLAIEIILTILLLFLAWRWSVRFLVAQKDRLEELVKQRTTELEKEKLELLKARAALEEQAAHDSLTGMLNRSAIFYQLALEIERTEREKRPLAIILADLDHFKTINDTYGHLTGDHVLRDCAQRLHAVIRPYDFIGRYGGEEFLLVLPGFPPGDVEGRIAAMHRNAFEKPLHCNGHELHITCSFGIAWYVAGKDSLQSLIEGADHALYLAKNKGRNRVEVYDGSASFSIGFNTEEENIEDSAL